MDLGIAGRVAIVTGASRGIGAQVTRDLAAEGCRVVACARNGDRLRAVCAGIDAVPVVVDLTAPDAPTVILDEAQRLTGGVDILVNNAGGNIPRRLVATTEDEWREGFEINFFAAVRLTMRCVPLMRDRRWGRIVSVASTYGRQPDPYFGPYSAAKAALINFSANLSRAFAADNVLSNCVIPGVTLTELVETNAAAAADAGATTVDDVMAKMMAKDPVSIGRFGDPAEVSAAVLFLASERASWITGSCVTVDGGTIRVTP